MKEYEKFEDGLSTLIFKLAHIFKAIILTADIAFGVACWLIVFKILLNCGHSLIQNIRVCFLNISVFIFNIRFCWCQVNDTFFGFT